ncbi:VOC family protein [Falsirhodobacter deserti]|uniref:VOC family protein n=1 Tax=Falsirhodobacter deserti TaxID=1365611 RepID=UPI000FE33EFF|nr:VOC family protein [Falsirhodobacter deserti]
MTQSLRIGRVTLTVNDLPNQTAFYRDAIGLNVLSQDGTETVLGAGRPLLVLRADKAARRPAPHEAGLFHTAFLLPGRAALASWLLHAARLRLPLGSADHDVSEALYLRDPEGNGIEIYADRPADRWIWADGIVKMRTHRLDLDELARVGGRWTGIPDGTMVGHVHLQVGALPEAEAFWTGLDAAVTHRYSGATFFGWNGYHHHLAANTWNSACAAPRAFPVTGLAEVELLGAPARTLHDPWGTSVRFAP